jgi:hypothetical protein
VDWITVTGAAATVGTVFVTVQKILKNFKRSHEERNAQVLQAAKEELSITKLKLEARIGALEASLETLKEGVSRDIAHVKETHSAELKNLGERIQEVREQLHLQHTQILQLLTALIDSK